MGYRKPSKLYRLHVQSVNQSVVDTCVADSLKQMHEKHAHASIKTVAKVFGLENVSDSGNFFSKGSAKGKMHRKSFKKNEEKRHSKVGDLLHADVCEPMSMDSIGKSKYFLLIKEDCSNFTFV